MARKNTKKEKDISLGQYQHDKKRVNNPQVGMVSDQLDERPTKKTYQHDPYIDPHLSWTGKAEGVSFNADTVSLHTHERIDPARIIQQVLKKKKDVPAQASLFEQATENLDEYQEFDFYHHIKNWSNRLIAGDSLLVMNSLLEKEQMAGKVQMIYIDPPYGIKYNSNFQPFTNKKDVKDKDDKSIPAEPEMIKAYRDTWELGIHSYLTYLRDRLLLAKELLHESGSVFVQINDENVHYVREIMDEVFGIENFIALIQFRTASTKPNKYISGVYDFIVWYGKDHSKLKFRELFVEKKDIPNYEKCIINNSIISVGAAKKMGAKINPDDVFSLLHMPASAPQSKYEFEFQGIKMNPINGWRVSQQSLKRLSELGRLTLSGNSLKFIKKLSDFPYEKINATWTDLWAEQNKIYVVQTATSVIERCILMATDPGDLVLDPTCGSGTTAFVAEQWGRRWITCDTSRVAIQLAKQRLMTAKFDYYELAYPDEGIESGFKYKTVPHITLGSIARGEDPKEETLYDQPFTAKNKVRVAGPFTVDAVPGVRTKPIDGDLPDVSDPSDPSNLLSEKLNDYIDNLKTSGIRSFGNQQMAFNNVEIAEGFSEVHAFGDTEESGEYKRCAIVFGPDYATMEQTQIERALEEWQQMEEKPQVIIFCSYAFDPEAAKDIDNIKIKNLQVLKAQMNTDLLTKDLKKKSHTDRPFWLIGEPDVEINKLENGKYQVELRGFDYYDPLTQELKSGGTDKIAMWMLDTDYDNRSILPEQVFFPMHDKKRDWTKLAKALNGEVDEELLEQYTGVVSIPFDLGEKKTIAIKVVDDRGVEMLIIKQIKS